MVPENSYDVVIAGAGPAGSLAARDCAKAGLKVLLLEKRPEVGAPKRCGEGVGLDVLKRIGYAGDERFVMQRFNRAAFFAPNGKRIEAPLGGAGCILERKLFDKYLVYDAAKAGAKVIAKAEVTGLLKDKGKVSGVVASYEGRTLEIASKIVVAADGVESKVSRMAGMNIYNRPMDIVSACQYEMAGIDIESPDKIHGYVGRKIAPNGYVWIFPKGKHTANVGLGIVGAKGEKTAKDYLDEFIESHPFLSKGSIIEENAGGVPVGGFLKKMTADNILMIGDAARQVNPIDGGGIAEGTYAASVAAKVIVRAISEGDTSGRNLDEYNKIWWKERGNYLSKLEEVMRAGLALSDDDFNYLMDAVDTDGFLRIVNRDIIFIAKLLARYPRLLSIAMKFV